ncbi:MAG: DUF6655 family protein [Planctomycetaceae bacterium]
MRARRDFVRAQRVAESLRAVMRSFPVAVRIAGLAIVALCAAGCGTSRSRKATEQLLISDAVDKTVGSLDFGALQGQKVYLDTQFVKSIKGAGFVNADYVISSLRNQMAAAGCLLQDKKQDADIVVEARVGALGYDEHEVSYGIPASNMLSTAAAFVPGAPPIPAIPEMSIAKKNQSNAAVKIAVFAYYQKTRRTVWQSGVAKSRSDSKDVWLMGAGPFQSGSIVRGAQFAGTQIEIPLLHGDGNETNASLISHAKPHLFDDPTRPHRKPRRIRHAEFLKPIPVSPGSKSSAQSSDGK